MSKELIKVNSEWDIGEDGILFEDMTAARVWVVEALVDSDIEETLEELEGEGLINYEFWTVIGSK